MTANALHNVAQIESGLWEAADQLRANSKLTSSEHCMPVLGVIFLRHATNRYQVALAAIQADQASGKSPKRPLVKGDFYKRRALKLPEVARYDHLLKLPSATNLGSAMVVLPSHALLEPFELSVERIYKQVTNLAAQNQKLRAARDLLLPRLMSGEITV